MAAPRERRSPLAARTRDGGALISSGSKPTAPPLTLSSSPLGKKNVRHLSPRKFHQLQQQQPQYRLSPLSARNNNDAAPCKERQHTTTTTSAAPRVFEPREPVPWTPAWLPSASPTTHFDVTAVEALLRAAGALGASASTCVGTTTLDAWLQSYEHEFLVYESLEHFVHVKLPEALAFCDKLALQSRRSPSQADRSGSVASQEHLMSSSRFHARLRIALFAHLMERTVFALSQSAALSHAKQPLFQARQEIFRAMFADYDDKRQRANDAQPSNDDNDDDSQADSDSNRPGSDGANSDSSSNRDDPNKHTGVHRSTSTSRSSAYTSTLFGPTAAPRTLAFFLSKVPFALKLREDTARRALRFQRHEAVLRRLVQSLFRSLGAVFHAWQRLVRQKKDERLHEKGAQLTAMVVQQRGLVRAVFVEWSKAALRSRVQELRSCERERRQQHEQLVADLHKEVFLLRERNRELQVELAATITTNNHSTVSVLVDTVAPTATTTNDDERLETETGEK